MTTTINLRPFPGAGLFLHESWGSPTFPEGWLCLKACPTRLHPYESGRSWWQLIWLSNTLYFSSQACRILAVLFSSVFSWSQAGFCPVLSLISILYLHPIPGILQKGGTTMGRGEAGIKRQSRPALSQPFCLPSLQELSVGKLPYNFLSYF